MFDISFLVKFKTSKFKLFSISENNFNFFDTWSKTSSKYNKESVIRQWNGYKTSSFNKNVTAYDPSLKQKDYLKKELKRTKSSIEKLYNKKIRRENWK